MRLFLGFGWVFIHDSPNEGLPQFALEAHDFSIFMQDSPKKAISRSAWSHKTKLFLDLLGALEFWIH